jgi:hypothetical protein
VPDSGASVTQGAYGLSLLGVPRSPLLLASPGDAWPAVEIVRRRWTSGNTSVALDDARATLPLVTGGQIVLERRGWTAVYETPEPLDDDDLIHPYLAPAASVFARWRGRPAFHAGAFILAGRAWGLFAPREGGKSTTLWRLHRDGIEIVADDLLVVDDGQVLAGPRAIDLRPGATVGHEHDPGREVRTGTRSRVSLPPIAAEAPLAGWVFLDWADQVHLARLRPERAIGHLNAFRMAKWPDEDPRGMLDLAALPAWKLSRPRGEASLEEAVGRLLSLVGG